MFVRAATASRGGIRALSTSLLRAPVLKFRRGYVLPNIRSAPRYASTIPTVPSSGSDNVTPSLDAANSSIADALSASDVVVQKMPYIGELAAHGLGSWTTPVGLIENLTEYATVGLGGSWIVGIAAVTLGIRVLMLPIVFNGMRNNYTMANLRPEIVSLQEKVKEVEATGDEKATLAARMKIVELFRTHNVNPLKAMLPLVTQMPIFVSFFFALRKMATAPIESLTMGGALWFPNLAVPDPNYVLPVLASAFLLATVELGSDGIQQQAFMKKFFRIMSVAMLPMTAQFPAAVLVYWITSNAFSLGQLGLSRAAFVKNYYKIPQLVQHNIEQKGFTEQMKEAYNTASKKAERQLLEKQQQQRLEALSKTVIPKTPKSPPPPSPK